jgi:hypothetical protein
MDMMAVGMADMAADLVADMVDMVTVALDGAPAPSL